LRLLHLLCLCVAADSYLLHSFALIGAFPAHHPAMRAATEDVLLIKRQLIKQLDGDKVRGPCDRGGHVCGV